MGLFASSPLRSPSWLPERCRAAAAGPSAAVVVAGPCTWTHDHGRRPRRLRQLLCPVPLQAREIVPLQMQCWRHNSATRHGSGPNARRRKRHSVPSRRMLLRRPSVGGRPVLGSRWAATIRRSGRGFQKGGWLVAGGPLRAALAGMCVCRRWGHIVHRRWVRKLGWGCGDFVGWMVVQRNDATPDPATTRPHKRTHPCPAGHSVPYTLEVLKNGTIVDQMDIGEKDHYTFGRCEADGRDCWCCHA